MATVRQIDSTLTKIATFFAKHRKILTKAEYLSSGPAPVRMNIILRIFGTYDRMIVCLREKHNYLEGMEEADKLENVKPAKAEPKVVKAPKAPVTKKPVARAPKKETSDE